MLTSSDRARSLGSIIAAGDRGAAWIAVCTQSERPPPALVDAAAEVLHRGVVRHVHGREGRGAAASADAVVELLEPAGGACDRDHMAGGRERFGHGGAEAAGRAGDEGGQGHARAGAARRRGAQGARGATARPCGGGRASGPRAPFGVRPSVGRGGRGPRPASRCAVLRLAGRRPRAVRGVPVPLGRTCGQAGGPIRAPEGWSVDSRASPPRGTGAGVCQSEMNEGFEPPTAVRHAKSGRKFLLRKMDSHDQRAARPNVCVPVYDLLRA